MTVYVVTGKLGAGKTLVAVGRIRDYLEQGRQIATNLDLNLHKLVGVHAKKTRVTRLPDIPTINDLEAIGNGYDGDYLGETRNGLLVLDECGSFLNSRDFNDKNRKGLRDWVIHARKKRWDVIFIIQHLNALDKQFREMFAEHVVHCIRTDRVPIPILSSLVKLVTGFTLKFPRAHRGLVKYGSGLQAITVDSWWYRGTTLYDAYDTEQAFAPNDEQRNYSYLPPYYTHGVNYDPIADYLERFRRFKKRLVFKARQFFFIGLLVGVVAPSYAFPESEQETNSNNDLETSAEQPQIQDPNYYIVGTLEIDGQINHLFQDEDGNTAYPKSDGYKIRPVNSCKVALIKNNRAIYATCPKPDAFDFMSDSSGEGTPADSENRNH